MRCVCAQLLADDFAANGFKTIAIDYFAGDPVPHDYLNMAVCPTNIPVLESATC
jgi:hypothetical protein